MLHFGHAATETSGTIDVESGVGSALGYVQPRAGWVISVTSRLDVNSISGGDVLLLVTMSPGGSVPQDIFYESAGSLQIQVSQVSPAFRFAAQARLFVQLVFTGTIEVADLVVDVEVELER